MTVHGRVAASWRVERGARLARVAIEPHCDIPRSAIAEIRAEGERIGRFCAPESQRVEVSGV